MLLFLEQSWEGELHYNLKLSIVVYRDKLKGVMLFLHVVDEAHKFILNFLSW